MRTARELALSALCGAVLALSTTCVRPARADDAAPARDRADDGAPSRARAPAAQPVWAPPPPITPVFGVAPSLAPPLIATPRPPDRRLHDSDVALRVGIAAGFAPVDTLDGALTARGYDASLAMPVLDLSFTARAVWWLFLGARIGTRWRPVDPPFGAPARERVDAAGLDALALAELRVPLGVFEISPEFGIGVGYGEVLQGGLSIARAAPRVTLGTSVSVWIVDPLRFVARLGWDLYRLGDVNDFGHAISLGGPTLGCGLEWRPH